MVIHKAEGLPERIGDGGAHVGKAPLSEVPAELPRLGDVGRDLRGGPPAVVSGPAAGPAPQVVIKTAEFSLAPSKGASVRESGPALARVTDDTGIGEETILVGRAELGHLFGVEPGQSLTVSLPAVEDGGPPESGRGRLQDQELEQDPIVRPGGPPLPVMVVTVEGVAVEQGPIAPRIGSFSGHSAGGAPNPSRFKKSRGFDFPEPGRARRDVSEENEHEPGPLVALVTDDDFEKVVVRSPLPVVVDFYADWARPCHQVEPVLQTLSKDLEGRVRFAKVNVDESEETAETYGVHVIPTFIFVEKGTVKGRQVGILAEVEFRRLLKKCFGIS